MLPDNTLGLSRCTNRRGGAGGAAIVKHTEGPMATLQRGKTPTEQTDTAQQRHYGGQETWPQTRTSSLEQNPSLEPTTSPASTQPTICPPIFSHSATTLTDSTKMLRPNHFWGWSYINIFRCRTVWLNHFKTIITMVTTTHVYNVFHDITDIRTSYHSTQSCFLRAAKYNRGGQLFEN